MEQCLDMNRNCTPNARYFKEPSYLRHIAHIFCSLFIYFYQNVKESTSGYISTQNTCLPYGVLFVRIPTNYTL